MADFYWLFTYLLGDGRFSNPDGTYYGKIDVGYLRQILYGGIAFDIFSCTYLAYVD